MGRRKNSIRNLDDQGAKFVFQNPELCAQLLRDYVPLDCLRSVTAEQIEDMSERFVTLWDSERPPGGLPKEAEKRILEEEDMETLKLWFRGIAKAGTAEAFLEKFPELAGRIDKIAWISGNAP